jgi:hypothetical protein
MAWVLVDDVQDLNINPEAPRELRLSLHIKPRGMAILI